MGNMKNLKSMVLDGNPMRSIRRDVIMRGTNELKKYLASRLSDEEKQSAEEVSYTNAGVPGSGDQSIKAHDLHQLKSLDYSNKKATSIPDDVVEAALEAGVRVVNLSKNNLTALPNNLSVLATKLTEMNLGINKLSKLSDDITQFNRLQHLDLRTNQLSDLPPGLSALTGLRELVISNNRFVHIPPVVYSLNNLEILFAHDNHVTEIDVQGFFKLTKLATLDLQNNDISQIPPELGNCVWLKSLALTGNPLRNPRSAVLAKGTYSLLEYLRSRIVV
uniref:Leucine-rich repeat-containing protein 40 n=1 Tax=Arion vulgaris TaxID=1028688 RepID=A0A0B7A1Q6_9EUPU